MTSEAPELLPCPFCGKAPHGVTQFGHRIAPDPSPLWAVRASCLHGHGDSRDEAIASWNTRADLSPQWRPISEAEDGDRIIVAGWQHQSGGTIGYWWYHEDVAWDGKAIEHPSATHFTSISLPPFPEAPNEP